MCDLYFKAYAEFHQIQHEYLETQISKYLFLKGLSIQRMAQYDSYFGW